MFIVSLTYKVTLSEVDKHLKDHRKYLDHNYKKGIFIVSGGKIPRTGGIILANIDNRSKLDEILRDDPFKIQNVADYEITEFLPTKSSEELKFLCK
ncbi:YciI family protein [Acinetobacter boissieri]|uniref:Uncharacterized conserved protein YciI, contains a putative active-site phosphohistidine n=1 Tax=Acinetobacter boissieri TaxID=1219383 RepID=A0A1G6JSD9_9GAMM|nr:YciI family protein [Acinetobacter boissieri]SDC21345.1 Uncharacterized conserved protein YciI, contains a putative active-site phosphohistidine [Acinetobacter boissieri]